MLTLLTTARGKTEAALLVARLRDAGIPCMLGGAEGPRGTPRSAREIYVDDASLPRAQEILEEDRGADFDEEELTRLSEEAGRRWAMEDSSAAQCTTHTADVANDDSSAALSTAHSADALEGSSAAQLTADTTDVAGDVQVARTTKGHRLRHAIDRLVGREADTPRDPFGR